MKKLYFLLFAIIITGFILNNCESKKKEDTDKVPLEVKQAEMKDSTRLDSAITDSTIIE